MKNEKGKMKSEGTRSPVFRFPFSILHFAFSETPIRRIKRKPRNPRKGVTLLEVSLVLGLLVVLAAVVWPQLDRPLASERLKRSADQLRADFTKARVAAMESGRTHSFQVDTSTGRYSVVPIDDLSDSDPFSLPAVGAMQVAPVLEGELPEGVRLATLSAVDDVTPPPAFGGAMISAPTDFGNTAAGPTVAAAPIGQAASIVYFHPDGTTSSAVATLAGEFELVVDVRLRGLTGATSVGEVYVGDPLAQSGAPAGATP
jgi:type II secretory pathway pseudopilin PulG